MTPTGSGLHPYPEPTSPKLTLLEEMVMVLTGAGSWKKTGVSFGSCGALPCPALEAGGQELALRRAWVRTGEVSHPP